MSCRFEGLPSEVRSLFPKENFEFATSINEDEAKHLKELLSKHPKFDEVDALMEECEEKNSSLHNKFKKMLSRNAERLVGLSPKATEFSKKCISYVGDVQVAVTCGGTVDEEKGRRLHDEFAALDDGDKAALKKNNPDIDF